MVAFSRRSRQSRGQIVRHVCDRLEATYGCPRHGNPRVAIDDLIYIILSNRSHFRASREVFKRLKCRKEGWGAVRKLGPKKLALILRPLGLSTIRAHQLSATLNDLHRDFGDCTLRPLYRLPDVDVQNYLENLPGVSTKVAKCVMLYTMGRQVLPVDTHVYRLSRRLGWVTKNRADQCHGELESLVPPQRRNAYHVCAIAHGRSVCRPSGPDCANCELRRYCEYVHGAKDQE